LLLAYQGFEQGVATFYDLPDNSPAARDAWDLFDYALGQRFPHVARLSDTCVM